MSIRVTVKGQKELDAKFKKLEAATQSKIMREAVEDGAKIVKADARSRVTSRSGKLRRGIKLGKAKKTKAGMTIDIRSDKFYSRMVELGHTIVVKTRGGNKVIGHVAGKPFMTPALDARKDEVVSAISFKFKQAVMKAAG